MTQYCRTVLAVAVVTFLRLTTASAQVTVYGGLEYEHFDRDLSPWKLATFEVSGKSDRGTLIGRVTEVERYDTRGAQFEVDAYPKFDKQTYAWLNFGASSSDVLARRRYAAELFHTFTGAWEASAGARRIEFEHDSSNVYTGSLGRYWGNYWAALRPSIADTSEGTFAAGSLTFRRYFATGDDWIGFDAQAGQTPDNPLAARELGLARWSGGIQGERLMGSVILRGRLGVESIDDGSGSARRGTIVTAGIGRRF